MCTFQPFYVRLAVPVSNKQMSVKTMYMEASALAKKKPKLSDNYFCTEKNEYRCMVNMITIFALVFITIKQIYVYIFGLIE